MTSSAIPVSSSPTHFPKLLQIRVQPYPVVLTVQASGQNTTSYYFDKEKWNQCGKKVLAYLDYKASDVRTEITSPVYSPLDWTEMEDGLQ